ncbi:hypothetical protein X961_4223 [Burkholderia pseudomallei MSHR5613]|nr:hypothetical protein DO62_5709 [Burkholderia pseudomallei]KGS19764.1 hypothetical protein X989_4053 [Burkholderia pseudomallei MSHR4378]KGS26300.1 hypothetical protein X941_4442 [Burkholderia pseudomallei MSHR5569]KGS39974.1 hypothetical protein X945_4400 [Burkholderia pseudomallei ABCPW 107]KGS41757.1 hypothetical protein X992_4594 [Burkholderia pseudomallei MSHR5492]KGS47304.1 hypothetical protein X961_4223 [Burkholderia pseudomallei MSHR5613]KGS57669.1 hypothetical protein X949_738 [Bur
MYLSTNSHLQGTIRISHNLSPVKQFCGKVRRFISNNNASLIKITGEKFTCGRRDNFINGW